MEEFNTKKDSFKNAICYIPFVAVVLSAVLDEKSITLQRNIRYGISLLIAYVVTLVLFEMVLFFLPFGFILFMIYLIVSAVYGYKAYNGDDIRISIFDKIYEKINTKN